MAGQFDMIAAQSKCSSRQFRHASSPLAPGRTASRLDGRGDKVARAVPSGSSGCVPVIALFKALIPRPMLLELASRLTLHHLGDVLTPLCNLLLVPGAH